MDKIEYHAFIKFFVKEGLTPNEIHSKFMGTLRLRFQQLRNGRLSLNMAVPTSLEDDPCEGPPKSATPPEIIEQVHNMVLHDRQIKVREIAEIYRHFKRMCRIYFS
jgi:hypothetical protein